VQNSLKRCVVVQLLFRRRARPGGAVVDRLATGSPASLDERMRSTMVPFVMIVGGVPPWSFIAQLDRDTVGSQARCRNRSGLRCGWWAAHSRVRKANFI